VVGQAAPRLAQDLALPRRITEARLAAQQPADPLGRIGHGLLEPRVEGLVEQPVRRLARGHLEERVDAGLHRPLAQQVGAERMDGPDLRDLQPRQRQREAVVLDRGGARARLLQLGAQPQLHLARRLVGERHREDAVEPDAAADERDDARDQLGGLAGARGSLDN
jgi:hypothetical protein